MVGAVVGGSVGWRVGSMVGAVVGVVVGAGVFVAGSGGRVGGGAVEVGSRSRAVGGAPAAAVSLGAATRVGGGAEGTGLHAARRVAITAPRTIRRAIRENRDTGTVIRGSTVRPLYHRQAAASIGHQALQLVEPIPAPSNGDCPARYLYTPYSLVKSTIAFTFSCLASSNHMPQSTIRPPPSPTTSMRSLT